MPSQSDCIEAGIAICKGRGRDYNQVNSTQTLDFLKAEKLWHMGEWTPLSNFYCSVQCNKLQRLNNSLEFRTTYPRH